ncbi:transposase [Bacillus cereus]
MFTCNAQTFQTFLTYVMKEYPNKHVILILDNTRYHHAIVLKDFLKQHKDNLTLLFLPSYSQNLNLIERVWKLLKERVVAFCYHGTELQLIQTTEIFVQNVQINTQQILNRIQCVNMSIF